jgi:hypothetical protein
LAGTVAVAPISAVVVGWSGAVGEHAVNTVRIMTYRKQTAHGRPDPSHVLSRIEDLLLPLDGLAAMFPSGL